MAKTIEDLQQEYKGKEEDEYYMEMQERLEIINA